MIISPSQNALPQFSVALSVRNEADGIAIAAVVKGFLAQILPGM